MNIEQMKKALKQSFKANQPVMLWGAPGIGKSEGMEQLAKEEGMDFIDVRLSQMDAVDLRGIPYRDPETCRTDWATPKIWPTENKPTLIAFDEINHGTQSTLSAAFQAIQERRIGDYNFPDQVRFVAAGNRASDRTYANQMPSALRNRFSHITVDPSEDDWVSWAVKSGVSPLITGFIRFSPQSLNEMQTNSDSKEELARVKIVKGNNAFATPRTWAAANRFIQVATDPNTGKTDHGSIRELLIGTLGAEIATKFNGYVELYRDLPDLDDVIAHPDQHHCPDKAGIIFAICSGLAAKANAKNFKNIIKYILKLPNEYQAMCIKDALSRDMSLSMQPEFATWASKNNHILF